VSSSEPPFALCGPGGNLVADGVQRRYRDVGVAQAPLRSGDAPIVLGTLPFDVGRPAELLAPGAVLSPAEPPDWPIGPLPSVRIAAAVPPPADYRARIARARDELAAPGNPLRKVVLARTLRLVADAPLDARVILRRLVAESDSRRRSRRNHNEIRHDNQCAGS
jgi:isochorismate synthase